MSVLVILRPFASQAAAFSGAASVGPDRMYSLTGADVLNALSAATVEGLNTAIYSYIRQKDEFFKTATDA